MQINVFQRGKASAPLPINLPNRRLEKGYRDTCLLPSGSSSRSTSAPSTATLGSTPPAGLPSPVDVHSSAPFQTFIPRAWSAVARIEQTSGEHHQGAGNVDHAASSSTSGTEPNADTKSSEEDPAAKQFKPLKEAEPQLPTATQKPAMHDQGLRFGPRPPRRDNYDRRDPSSRSRISNRECSMPYRGNNFGSDRRLSQDRQSHDSDRFSAQPPRDYELTSRSTNGLLTTQGALARILTHTFTQSQIVAHHTQIAQHHWATSVLQQSRQMNWPRMRRKPGRANEKEEFDAKKKQKLEANKKQDLKAKKEQDLKAIRAQEREKELAEYKANLPASIKEFGDPRLHPHILDEEEQKNFFSKWQALPERLVKEDADRAARNKEQRFKQAEQRTQVSNETPTNHRFPYRDPYHSSYRILNLRRYFFRSQHGCPFTRHGGVAHDNQSPNAHQGQVGSPRSKDGHSARLCMVLPRMKHAEGLREEAEHEEVRATAAKLDKELAKETEWQKSEVDNATLTTVKMDVKISAPINPASPSTRGVFHVPRAESLDGLVQRIEESSLSRGSSVQDMEAKMTRLTDHWKQTKQASATTVDGTEKNKAPQPDQDPSAATYDMAPLKQKIKSTRASRAERYNGESSTWRQDEKDTDTNDEAGNAMAATASAPQSTGNGRMPRYAAVARPKGKYPAEIHETNGVIGTIATTSIRARLKDCTQKKAEDQPTSSIQSDASKPGTSAEHNTLSTSSSSFISPVNIETAVSNWGSMGFTVMSDVGSPQTINKMPAADDTITKDPLEMSPTDEDQDQCLKETSDVDNTAVQG
ncbi:hypothetical protein BGZ47_006119 [Haplosporangium gracile]|nr:hypothetical protein BGZ47_006119 [Haplosporangium gracile]